MADYLSVEFPSGTLYEYSKVAKEGFESHTSSTGKVSYRKYERKGITGKLQNVGIRNSEYGDDLQIALKDEEGTIKVLSFKLFDGKMNVDQMFAEPIIRVVGNLKKGENYKVFPYIFKAEDQKSSDEKAGNEIKEKYYDRTGVSFKYADDESRVDAYLQYKGDDESLVIPKIVWKDHPTNPGKRLPSAASLEAKNEFLINHLKEAINNGLAYEAQESSTETVTDKPNAPEPNTSPAPTNDNVGDEDYDDLPF